ncbi:MAG: GAF domain-containing protein [Pseudomonadota bacterium]
MNDSSKLMIDQNHLHEMIEVISGELELPPLLTKIVQKACELLHADRGSIGLIYPQENIVRIEAVYKMPAEELGSANMPGQGLAGQVYRDQKPRLLSRYGDIENRPLSDMDEDSVIGMPIMWRGEIIGTFGIGADPPKRFGDNDIRMLEVFARHAGIAINNARAYEKEKQYAALKERQRLARDLHDNVSQLIFSMSLVAQSISSGFSKSIADGEARVQRLLDITGLAQVEMKALLKELRSPGDHEGESMADLARQNGLAAALERHVELTAPDNAAVAINIGETCSLTEEQAVTLLRIAQEALANAFRHGCARVVDISLDANANKMHFIIENDGVGLPDKAAAETTHMGLSSMTARAAAIGGQIDIKNRPNGGVAVEVVFSVS